MMAQSSDEIIKREIVDTLGYRINRLQLRVFPESSNYDQKLFEEDGLTFSFNGISYGSCDACWFIEEDSKPIPVIALEGTDALNRGSTGNAQLQRFHHALGAVRRGIIGIYYLKKGTAPIYWVLYGMAFYASKYEEGTYLVIDDLEELRVILQSYHDPDERNNNVRRQLDKMYVVFQENFNSRYKGELESFAKARSTIIMNDCVIKHAGRMRRNFTDPSQRAGHIAVGEMYLTKYFFYGKKFYYLWPKMTKEDLEYLDAHKKRDKEWILLRNEPNVEIKTCDHIKGIPKETKDFLYKIKDMPLKHDILTEYNKCVQEIVKGLNDKSLTLI